MSDTITDPPWKSMNDTELWEYAKSIAVAGNQSSEWENIPLDPDRLHTRLFAKYKSLRDGK